MYKFITPNLKLFLEILKHEFVQNVAGEKAI